MTNEKCLICGRELGDADKISKHHLIPKSNGGRSTPTILIHNICHQKIHSVFTLKELKDEFHTVEQLTNHEEIKKFIKWVSKKGINYYQRNKRMKRKFSYAHSKR